jgi:hypothetical protein
MMSFLPPTMTDRQRRYPRHRRHPRAQGRSAREKAALSFGEKIAIVEAMRERFAPLKRRRKPHARRKPV